MVNDMRFVQAGDYRIHYRQSGTGEPLVCLHGMSNNSWSWSNQLQGLSEEFTVIAWDAPGYGLSSDPSEPFRHFRQFAEVLNGFLEALGIESCFLLGHSMGAAVAVEFYSLNPGMVKSLILADATRGAAALSREENDRRLKERLHNIETMDPRDIAEKRVGALLSPHAPQAVIANAKSIMSQVRPMGYKSVAYSLHSADQMTLYSRIAAPALVICGELDRVTPASESAIIHEQIKGSLFRMIPRTGHLCYQEDPDTFNLLVREFLS